MRLKIKLKCENIKFHCNEKQNFMEIIEIGTYTPGRGCNWNSVNTGTERV